MNAPFNPSFVNAPSQAPAPWANMNTYAPWTTPNGANGNSNPSFGGYGAESNINPWSSSNLTGMFDLGGSWFGLGNKRSSPDFYAPSYQGSLFTPTDGSIPNWYNQSSQGMQASQQAMMPTSGAQSMQPNMSGATGQFGSPQQGGQGSFGQFSAQPNYIGQSPFSGSTPGIDYTAGQGMGGLSYGGYSSYGGYGASGSTPGMSQPFVPGM